MSTKIYTSYYASSKIDKSKQLLVQISNSAPYKVDELFKLAIPDWSIVRKHKAKSITDADYRYLYISQLNSKRASIVERMIKLYKLAKEQNKDLVLLCYERPDAFCHRHIFAEWFNDAIDEFKNYNYIKIEGEL